MSAGRPRSDRRHVVATLLLVPALSVLTAAAAWAHVRSMSYSVWDIRGRQAHVMLRLSALDLSAVSASMDAAPEHSVGAYLTEHVRLFAGTTPCAVADSPQARDAVEGRAAYEWRVDCAPTGPLRIETTLLLDVIPSHLHFVRVSVDGAPYAERVLSDGERAWILIAAPAASLAEYALAGVRRICTGYDQIAFLLALLLIGGAAIEIAKAVAGFALAQSATLVLAVLGPVRTEDAAVAALIGFTVALVAAENVWLVGGRDRVLPRVLALALGALAIAAGDGYGRVPAVTFAGLALFTACYFGLVTRRPRPAVLRWPIACACGLVHGLGGASVLTGSDLSGAPLVPALCGFNLGVVAGQTAVALLLWMVLRLTLRSDEARRSQIVGVSSAAVFGLGLFWFVARAYG